MMPLMKDILSDVFSALGVCWLLQRFAIFFLESIGKGTGWLVSSWVFLGIILGSVVYSVAKNWPYRKISFQIAGTDARVTIKFGDIVKEGGNIAIPSSNYFNTKLDILGEKTVLHQYIQAHFNGNNTNIDNDLNESFKGITPDKTKVKAGKTLSYPMGSVGVFNAAGNKKGFLAAITKIEEDVEHNEIKVESNMEYVFKALDQLWDKVNVELDDEPLDVVPFGSGVSKSFNKKVEAIMFMVQSFIDRAKHKRPCSALNMYLRRDDITLNEFSELRKVVHTLVG